MKNFSSTKGSTTERSGPAENRCRLAFSPCNLFLHLKNSTWRSSAQCFMLNARIAQKAGVTRMMALEWWAENSGAVQLSSQVWH